ncbi:probable cytochrome P450 6a21 [Stomoxys calcitrans]|uniref:probable cytochrome P450 6a21 n=1 Tax=Stomoxys calcitrans TaxID=35570 RepID=UPI0027E37674|nr:probable cytochrome P450 6a21 [Stomoxys calcitrans]
MSVSTILLACVIFLFVYLGYKKRKQLAYWRDQGVACDTPHWLLGNVEGIMSSRSYSQIIKEYYEKFKNFSPFVGFYWFTKPAVFVLDPVLMKHILVKDFSKFIDRGLYNNAEDDPLTGHLLNLEGDKWRYMRNKLSPTFTSGKMKAMFPLVMEIGDKLMEVANKSLATSPVMEVRDLVARFTTDVIGTCAFGLEINSLHNPEVEFRKMSRKALTEQRYGTLGFMVRFNFPQLSRRLHLKETMEDVEKFFLGIAKSTVDYREQHNVRRNDFMDMLIDLKNNKLMKSDNGEELTNLTFGQLAAQAFVFLLAGYETSSTTMSFALYELALNQAIQEKAREEVVKVLGAHNNCFTYECMKDMVYLEQIIEETLRLYTIVPAIIRIAADDFVVPDHPKHVIKKGMHVFIPSAAIHRDERYFPQPNVFNPDHFSPDKVAARDTVLNLSFGDGPRNCIGARFGKMQAIVGLALLLANFKFSTCDRTPIPMKIDKKSLLLSSEGGIPLLVQNLDRK